MRRLGCTLVVPCGTPPVVATAALGPAESKASALEPPNVLMVRWIQTRGEVFSRAGGTAPFGTEDGEEDDDEEDEIGMGVG